MYWLDANSTDRQDGESWEDYVHRSCVEVRESFEKLVQQTDFSKESLNWNLQIDPTKQLVFVAYFVGASDLARLSTSEGARQ
jgi:hypothetical protein